MRRGQKGEGILVERPISPRTFVQYSFGTNQYAEAYERALRAPEVKGRAKPRWFDPDKPRKAHPEWDECPF